MHPRQIGPYLIERQIGKGGMGTVYLAKHHESGALAAVKVLPASFATEEGFVARFSREIEAMKLVDSPNIVDFFESGGGENDTYFYAMEYVPGETLTAHLRRVKRLTWEQTVNYSMQIAAALKAVHSASIVHRDLKPSNLMISEDGIVKLTDFGVAHMGSGPRLTRTGGVIGTAEFMSPEQARGVKASKASDLYSLGTVMYAMLTGRPPFTGKNAADVIHKQQYHQPDKPSRFAAGIPLGLEILVLRLLEKRPERRPGDASLVIRELNRIRQSISSANETNVTLDGEELLANASAPTRASDQIVVPHDDDQTAAEDSPGEGTILERLLRNKLRHERVDDATAGLFNNTWFLVAVLLLLLYTAYMFVGRAEQSADAILKNARETLQNPPGSSWLTVKAELETLTEPEERTKAGPLLDRIEQWEQSQAIRRMTLRMPVPGSEAERILMKAQNLIAAGRTNEAESELNALVWLLNGDPRYEEIEKLAHKTLQRVHRAGNAVASRIEFIDRMMDRAEGLRKNDPASAIRIWEGVVALYSDDPTVTQKVQACEQALVEAHASPSAVDPSQENESGRSTTDK